MTERIYTMTLEQLGQVVGDVLEAASHHCEPMSGEQVALLTVADMYREAGQSTPKGLVARSRLEDAAAALTGPRFGHMHIDVESPDRPDGEPLGVRLVYNPGEVRDVLAWARRLVRNRMVLRLGRTARKGSDVP